ncbi:MAG TPA: DUF3784 domain-containing protein [Mucilaginibacter sp.]|jgi:uncharacterized membrane protein|nr:DUF3784 domain-containing protein [Mucilaginibacter sp.]
MNKSTAILEFTLAGMGLLFLLLGYLIKYKKKMNLIAGYDPTQIADKDGLANWMGGVTIVMGSILMLSALALHYFPGHQTFIMNTFIASILIGCVTMVVGSYRYKAK